MTKETILFTPYDGPLQEGQRYAFEPERLGAEPCGRAPVISGPIYTQDEVAASIKYLDKLHLEFCDIVFSMLNEMHNVNLSHRYWMTLTGYFFYAYLHIMYDRWTRFQRVREKLGEFKVAGLAKDNWRIPETPFGFCLPSWNDELFNRQIYSLLAEHIGGTVDGEKHIPQDWYVEGNLLPSRHGPLNRFLDRGYHTDICFHSSMLGRKNLLLLMLHSRLKVGEIRFTKNRVSLSKPDLAIRKTLCECNLSDPFEKFALQALEYVLPLAYVEQFDELRTEAKKNITRNQPSIIITGMGLLTDVNFSFWAAETVPKTLLVGLQHGGNYGELQDLAGELAETRISDFYLTWGETEKDREFCVGALRFMHERLPDADKQATILWVTTHEARFGQFFNNCVIPPRMAEYFAFQQRLLESLPKEVITKVALRLYPHDLGWGLKERWDKSAIDISSMNSISFKQALARTELVLLDTVGSTTLYQCLHHDLPFMIVADRDLFLLNDRSQQLYRLLESVNVLHWDVDRAAIALSEACNDPKLWWREKARRKAVLRFRAAFFGEPSIGSLWRQLQKLRKAQSEIDTCEQPGVLKKQSAFLGSRK